MANSAQSNLGASLVIVVLSKDYPPRFTLVYSERY